MTPASNMPGAGAVQVYWRPGCPFCMMLLPRLRRSGLPLREINIWRDRAAAARVRAITGGDETVPTVVVGTRALVNPSVRQVVATARAEWPGVLPDGPAARGWLSRIRKRRGTAGPSRN